MGDRNTSIQSVRDRLTGLLADWGVELSLVLKELEDKRARLEELEGRSRTRRRGSGAPRGSTAKRASSRRSPRRRGEASKSAGDPRRGHRPERVGSELESKKELDRALCATPRS
jgi:hypothetical protein